VNQVKHQEVPFCIDHPLHLYGLKRDVVVQVNSKDNLTLLLAQSASPL